MTPDTIINACAKAAGVTPEDISGKSRQLVVVQARQVAAFIMRRMGMSLKATGSVLRRDHTTVITCVEKVEHVLPNLAFHLSKTQSKRRKAKMPHDGHGQYKRCDRPAIIADIYAKVTRYYPAGSKPCGKFKPQQIRHMLAERPPVNLRIPKASVYPLPYAGKPMGGGV